MAPPLLLKTITQIADGTAVYIEQDHEKATLAPKLKKKDGFLGEKAIVLRQRRKVLQDLSFPRRLEAGSSHGR